jgi:transposase
MEARELRGMEIAKTAQIVEKPNGWVVPSQTERKKTYFVNERYECNCPDSTFHKTTCKHSYAIRYYLQVEKETPKGITTEKVRISYKQAWGAYNQAQTEEIKLFDVLLKDLTQSIEEPPKGFGRPKLSLQETAFCAIQKVYSQLSSRRAVSLFGNAVEKGQICHKPHFNAVSKLLNRPELTPILHELLVISASPLKSVEKDFAVDSSGFRTTNFNEYAEDKYNFNRQHKWLKAHICIGTKTNVITAVEITGENGADSPQFAPLVMATSESGFDMQEVSADKAYSSRANLEAVKDIRGIAYIPFRSNATGHSRGSYLWTKMFHYFQFRNEEFAEHYHKRSNVESTFGAIKKKLGDKLKSKNKVAQENELICKLIAYNLTVVIHEMFELGIKPNFI